MEDTLSNQDLDASHTIIGTDSEATAASSPRRDFRAVAACGGLASLAAVVIGAGILIRPPTASAVPSFARQTGQPCATCHTAFPELTPFGRRFKLGGYTMGGGLTIEEAPPVEHRELGLTPKNLRVVRAVLSGTVWQEMVDLPERLMAEAKKTIAHAPHRAALSAQIAIGIAILTFAPVRINNLVGIRIGQHLIRPAGLDGNYLLSIPSSEVKNRVPLEFPLDAELSRLIDHYIQEFRPHLLDSTNNDQLFPGVRPSVPSTVLVSESPGRSKKISASASHAINSGMLRRRLSCATIRATTNLCAGFSATKASRRLVISTSASKQWRPIVTTERFSAVRSRINFK